MTLNLKALKSQTQLKDRYPKQLERLKKSGLDTKCVEKAVGEACNNLGQGTATSLVVYGDPQSGKTEMMICLTAKLLDEGHPIIVHLMNDSVDLLTQNLKRFKASGLAPAPRSLSELLQYSSDHSIKEVVVFCKKNARDLGKLIERLDGEGQVVVIDDEADYATPNAKVNQGTKTKINNLVGELIGAKGRYIGVTATPARLDLNNTFQNQTEKWVYFQSHNLYTGQDIFFPLDTSTLPYRLTPLIDGGSPEELRSSFVRFLVTAAYLNASESGAEQNYTMLVHTSGKKQDHEADRQAVEKLVGALVDSASTEFDSLVTQVHETAKSLYPNQDADKLTEYVVKNASRVTPVVLNSERDRKAVGESATEPSSHFTIIIGGNIVSRGVTFPNLLTMFFTRTVKQKLQQDTYIQRARMFGSRGKYLKHFELAIPPQLFADWHKCFVFHKLALATIRDKSVSPVWIGDSRVSVAAGSSVDKATVVLDQGEMSFAMFDYSPALEALIAEDQTNIATLKKLQKLVGTDALPSYLIDYIETVSQNKAGQLAVHTSSSIAGSGDADKVAIARKKGFIGKSQLEPKKFPEAVHHVKIFHNGADKARVFYKFRGSLQFMENWKSKKVGSNG